MERISKLTRLVLSAAALILAVSAFVFVLKYDPKSAHGVAGVHSNQAFYTLLYTQSADGKTLYQWVYSARLKKWVYVAYRDPDALAK